jgi:hypothetical protein
MRQCAQAVWRQEDAGRLSGVVCRVRGGALDLLWVLTACHSYEDLLTGVRWTPDQYET